MPRHAAAASAPICRRRCSSAQPDDYDGGELVVEDTYGTQSVKLPAGDLVLYPATSLHRVTPVTRGARLQLLLDPEHGAATMPSARLLFELDRRIIESAPTRVRRTPAVLRADGRLSQPRPQMGRAAVSAPRHRGAWRVAALTMMPPAELRALFSGPESRRMGRGRRGLRHRRRRSSARTHAAGRPGRAPATRRAAFALFSAAADAATSMRSTWWAAVTKTAGARRRNSLAAAALYAPAADAGLAWAQYNLGHLLLDGNGVTRDRIRLRLVHARAAQGHERAMNLVARCYEEGWGVARMRSGARLVSPIGRGRLFPRRL